jgi:hypothetical protein
VRKPEKKIDSSQTHHGVKVTKKPSEEDRGSGPKLQDNGSDKNATRFILIGRRI